MEDIALGRREENKQRTRSALEQAAAQLFAERGYGATTVRDIAAAAGVGERTFFRYFPSKEDLVLQEVRNLVPGLMKMVRERPAAESPLTAFREAVVAWLDATGTAPTILVSAPSDDAGWQTESVRALESDLEDAVTLAFLDRLEAAGAERGARPTVLRAAILARAAVGVVRGMVVVTVKGEPLCGGPAEKPMGALSAEEIGDAIREAFAVLEP